MQAALRERLVTEIALHREHLAERVGDRRAGGEHECPAGVLGFDEARLHIEVPGALRAVRIDTLQGAHIGREIELAKLLRLVDDDLVDADLGDRQKIVLAGRQRFQPLLQALLQPFEPLARDTVVAFDLGQQGFVKLQLVLDHLLLKRRGYGDEAERRMRDDDRVPCRRRRT